MSVKAVIAHIFQPGVRNWSVSVSWREIEVFYPRRETLQVYKREAELSRDEQTEQTRIFEISIGWRQTGLLFTSADFPFGHLLLKLIC